MDSFHVVVHVQFAEPSSIVARSSFVALPSDTSVALKKSAS